MKRASSALPLLTFMTLVLLPNTALSFDYARYSPYSSLFYNQYDYDDADSYGTNLFTKLMVHLSAVKRENCSSVPVPKSVLKQKYFNPAYELMHYKYWYPPKENQYIMLWSQNEAYRSSLFLSYMLQNDNAKFPPGRSV